MYVPHAQRAWTFMSFFVRTASDPRAVFGSLPAAVQAVDAERPLERMRTLDELVNASTSDRRALSALLALAAVVALLISAIGVYGVTAATTAARKRELAIRAAIGADRGGLMRLVVRQGMVAALVGIVLGIAGALAASSLARIGALRGRSPRSAHLRRRRPGTPGGVLDGHLSARRDGHLPSAQPSP